LRLRPWSTDSQRQRRGRRENRRGKQFSEQLKELLQQALALAAEKDGIDAADYRERVEDLDNQLTFHLRDRVLRDQDNQTLLNGVGAQHDKGHVLRFLGEDGVEPTNNGRNGICARR